MYKIDFLQNVRVDTRWECPACGAFSVHVGVTVDSGRTDIGVQELGKCEGCSSWFYLGEDPVIGYQDSAIDSKYWMHYVQAGAGIHAMLRPIMALGQRARGTFLDVGCGFGFVPDFWVRSGRGSAIGLEAASYGKIGKRLLGVDIHHEYLADCDAVKGRTFDVVYSSEVIEHVRNPAKFLQELGTALAPEGVLILTTPSASCVREDFDQSSLHAALSPGFHYFLLSRERFRQLLAEAGFGYCFIEDNGEKLTAWASRVPLDAPVADAFDWDEYLAYLEKLIERDDPHLRGGAFYRLFKDSMNTGHMDLAVKIFPRLENFTRTTYGIDLTFPNIAEAMKKKNILDSLDVSPAWFGSLLLFSGIFAGNELRDPGRKLRLLEASTHVLRHDMEIGLQFAQEAAAFLPVATFNHRMALAEFLSAEIPRGLGREVLDEYSRPNEQQILNFQKRMAELGKTIKSWI